MRAIGDCDGDSFVTLLDLQSAPSCVLGPLNQSSSVECTCYDLNSDGHVDLFDMAYWQAAFTGGP